MAELYEKTRSLELFACPDVGCDIVTFIRHLRCPACDSAGLLLRHADWERGAPMDPRQMMLSDAPAL